MNESLFARMGAVFLLLSAVACTDDVPPSMEGEGEREALPGEPCNGTVDCTPGSICYSNVCVQKGPLRISMSWDDETDIDLHVLTPVGNVIHYSHRTADAGELDVDDCVGEICDQPGKVHVENVFFNEALEEGTYKFWAVNFSGALETTVTVESFGGTGGGRFRDRLPAVSGAEGTRHTVTVP